MLSLSGRLYRFDQVPPDFCELGIIYGYRNPRSSFRECLKSLFSSNNETMNFWTHFLPTFYFLWRLLLINEDVNFAADSYTWPLLVFIIVCCIYPFTSAFAHAFNTMSNRARHICFFFDYASLSCYSFGSAMIYKAYAWPEHLTGTTYADWYLHGAFVNAVACTLLSGRTRFWQPGLVNKVCRLGAFGLPYWYDMAPIIHRILYCEEDDCLSEALMLHKRQFVFALSSAFLYASHLPERVLPGRFDIIGHSHQMFHVTAIFATRDVLNGIVEDMKGRREYMLSTNDHSVYSWSLAMLATLVIINLVTIGMHVKHLYQTKPENMNNNVEKCHCH